MDLNISCDYSLLVSNMVFFFFEQDRHTVLDYAVRMLKYNGSISSHSALAEAPTTPDRQNDVGILEITWEDQLSEVRTRVFRILYNNFIFF